MSIPTEHKEKTSSSPKERKNHKAIIGICIACVLIAVSGLLLFFLQVQLIKNAVVLSSALLTVAALGFSIFASIYSNLLHTAEMADGNALQVKLHQGSAELKSYWRKMSHELRGHVKLRAYSANCCLWSLILAIVCLVIVITQEKIARWYLILFGVPKEIPHWWLILSGLSILFLIIALFVHNLVSCKKLDKCLSKLFGCPIIPKPPKLTKDC